MSAGLIVGFVSKSDKTPISGAEVWLTGMSGTGVGYDLEFNIAGNYSVLNKPAGKTDSHGFFKLPFAWSGADIGEAVGSSGKLNMTLVVQKDIQVNSFYSYAPGGRFQITAYLVKDVLGSGGLNVSPFQSLPDLLGFSKSLIEAFREVKSHPLFSSQILTGESWLILAGTVINIDY